MAEAPDKIREVVEPAQGGDGTDRVRALPEQIGRVSEPVIRQVFAESESRLAAEDPHEVSVAVVNKTCGVAYRDRLRKVILDVEQDLLDGILVGGRRQAFLAAPMGVERKEKTKQAAAHQKRIAVRPLAAGIVSRVKGSGYLGVHRGVRVDRAGEAQGPHLQRGQNIAPCPVVFNLIVQKGEGEYDILVLHPHAGVAVDGVEFTGEDGHDGTGHDGIFAGSGGHCAAPFFDIDDLHLVVPVQIHPGKVLGDGTQVSVVGETRLLMQQGLSVL